MKGDYRVSVLTISCKDGSRRIIKAIGLWTISMAISLAKDLERENYKNVAVVH